MSVFLVHGVAQKATSSDHVWIKSQGLQALCSQVPANVAELFKDPDMVAKLAVRHNDILLSNAKEQDVLPLRLGAVFQNEESVRQLLEREQERFITGLTHIAGAVEIGVQIAATPAAKADDAVSPAQGDGQSYLQRKAAQRQRHMAFQQRARDLQTQIAADLGAHARDMKTMASRRRKTGDSNPPVWQAAFLVARAKHQAFGARVADLADAAAELGLTLVGSDPRPPYNFLPEA